MMLLPSLARSSFTNTTPFLLTAICLAPPRLSANTVALNPAGNVIPPLSSSVILFALFFVLVESFAHDTAENSNAMNRIVTDFIEQLFYVYKQVLKLIVFVTL